jgi:hypothetical protein
LDLVYSHSGTLYNLIPHAPHPSNDPTKPALELGYISNIKTIYTPAQTSKVNAFQSTSSQQPGGKNINKGKSKKYSNQQDTTETVDTQSTRKATFPCMIYEENHYKKYFPHREVVAKFLKGTSQPVQQQHLVEKNHDPPQGGDLGHSHHGDASTSASEVYIFKMVNVMTQENTYKTPLGDKTKGNVLDHPSTSTPPPYSNPLHIEKPIFDVVLCSPKSGIQKETFNPKSHAAQKYSIVEDLA